jgi:transcriptional regulator with GAF, ATPase, and Fis domain
MAGCKNTGVKTELGRAMKDNQAKAALMILEALEKVGWRITEAAPLLGYKDYGQLDDYITQLGLRRIVQNSRRKAWQANHIYTPHKELRPIELLRRDGDVDGMRMLLIDAVRLHKGCVQRAARTLGLSDTGIRLYITKMGLNSTVNAIRRTWGSNQHTRSQWKAMQKHRGKRNGRT